MVINSLIVLITVVPPTKTSHAISQKQSVFLTQYGISASGTAGFSNKARNRSSIMKKYRRYRR